MKEYNYIELSNKILLTVKEAAALFNIGENLIRNITDSNDCDFVIWIGYKRMIKRKKFEEFIEHVNQL